MMIAYIINSKFLSEGNTRGVVIGAIIYQILQITLMILLGRLIEVTGISDCGYCSHRTSYFFFFIKTFQTVKQ